ncbi:MAG: hypothetical protein K1X94_15335 [Sandaracinaceae bacterium]|nr:hypothetical protein [Sandaracinaceae bacterium]
MTVEMRGAAFLSFFEGIEELRDRATADAVKEALRPELRERVLSGAITRVGWYPMAEYTALHEALDRVVSGGPEFAVRLGYVTTDRDTRGLLRYVLAFTSPDLLIRYADKVFMSYVRGASMSIEQLGPRHYLVSWSDHHGASRALFDEWRGGIQLLMERCGGKNVVVAARPFDDPARAQCEVTWE